MDVVTVQHKRGERETHSEQPLLVTVAILTWNRRTEVERAVRSALAQTYESIEVLVVDSASSDGTADALEQQFPAVKVYRLHRNLGCPEGRNVALANAKGAYVFCLDDDGWLPPDTIAHCVGLFSLDATIGVVTCRILAPGERISEQKGQKAVRVFNGGASMIRREVLERAGYYPSDFVRQAEESDLALRMLDAGFKIVYTDDAAMFHAPSTINRNRGQFMYYGCRNELFTVVRLYPWYLVPFFIIQKCGSWLLAGMREFHVVSVTHAMLSAMLKFPELLSLRRPVSLAAIKQSYRLRG